jgi:DNA invertase Pin-like site-specific DNA recombinase
MQVQHFKSVIDNNPNYELVKIYTDEGISGTSVDKRKGFREMIEDACAGKIDLILTKSISRFGRNIVDILTTLRKLSDLNPPVAVNFESEGINTSDGKNKLIISILSALAELESQQKSIAIKEGIRYRMQEGLYKFSVKNTIGYYRDYSGRVKIEPAEAEIVRYIFDSFTEGASPNEIANSLTSQGIRSPMGMAYWRQSTISNILRNEKYCGDVRYQKSYSKDYLTHKSVKNNNVLPQWYWENNHPAIIKREQWNKAQELFAAKKWRKNSKPPEAMEKKFTVAKVKSGVLAGYFLLDMSWTKEERDQFIEIINSINELENVQEERN